MNLYAIYLTTFNDTIIKQTLLFLEPETLRGEKLDVYCLAKMLKYFTGADVTSYKVEIVREYLSYLFRSSLNGL